MVRIVADGGGVSYQPPPTTTSSSSSTPASGSPHGTRSAPLSPAQKATCTALDNYRSNKPATQQKLETALWNEALSGASATQLLNHPAAYRAEAAKLQQEYSGSLPKGTLDKVWASAAANARARYDQAPTTRALQQCGNAKLHTKGGPAPNSAATTNAQRASLAEVMDHYMAEHGQYFVPGTAGYASEEAKALADPKGLAAAERAFEQAQNAALPKGVRPSDLVGLAKGGELDAATALVGRSKSGSLAWKAATNALSTDGFDEEVMNYEFANHEGYATPGSAQWTIDAESLLGHSAALTAARDAVAMEHESELSASGLNVLQFGTDLWAGETAAQAQLTQLRDEHPPLVCTPNEPDQPPLSALDRQKQAEWDALTSLSDALNNVSSSAVDPALARQSLMANGYVQGLAGQINRTMQAVGASAGNTPADAIAFLGNTVKSSRIDPQLATMVVSAATSTLRADLKALSSASSEQAAQGFSATAGIYYTLQLAAQASVPGATSLANAINLWSYQAANSTNSTITVFSSSPSPLEQMLQQVLSTAQQQKVVPNLFHAWVGLTQSKNWAPVNNGLQQNAAAWSGFQQTLNATRQLDYVRLPPNTPLTTPSPVQTGQQVHATYDQAVMALEQNGDLPSTIAPAAAAAMQTMMSAGYVAGDEIALARAMIADNTQQLDAAWLQQHAGQGLTMLVDFFTAQSDQQVTSLKVVSSRIVKQALKGLEAPLPTAPSYAAIARTNSAFATLEGAKASGNQLAIATAQQAMNEAIANELLSVYPDQFPGSTLLTNDENSDWRILAEEQVASDHAGDSQLASQLPALLESGEITQASIIPGHDAQSVAALDASLAPFQRPGADPGSAITQAVLNDARVRELIGRQVSAGTTGINADQPTAALAREAAFLSTYEQNDPNGPVADQIVAGTIAAPSPSAFWQTPRAQWRTTMTRWPPPRP
jgi:hypothetical protein